MSRPEPDLERASNAARVALVSVVVPAHNAQGTIERSLQSLLDQTFSRFEVLVVDDGSTDATGFIAEAFAASDPRVSVLRQHNTGVSSARNAGLAAAQGSHLTFLDADDWVEPFHLELLVARAEETSAAVVQAGYVVDTLDASGRTCLSETRSPGRWSIGLGNAAEVVIRNDLLNSIGYVWNKLYSLEALLQANLAFDTNLAIYEDVVFNAELLASGVSLATVPDSTIHYVQTTGESLGKASGRSALEARWEALQAMSRLLSAWNVPSNLRRDLRAQQALQALRSDLVRDSRRPRGAKVLGWGREDRRSEGRRALTGVVLREGSWRQRAAALLLMVGRPVLLVMLRARSRPFSS